MRGMKGKLLRGFFGGVGWGEGWGWGEGGVRGVVIDSQCIAQGPNTSNNTTLEQDIVV